MIEAGKSYWVELEGCRLKVVALKPSSLPAWWHGYCESTGEGVVLPETAFLEEISPNDIQPPI